MEIRDPIHNFIEFDAREERVINSRPLQRLRRIRQLALSTLAYPGAHHSRFEHSLGAMHVAGRLADRLALSAEETRSVRLAALLHDVGHGPFSHVTEELLEEFGRGGSDPVDGRKIHERVTLDILRTDPELAQHLGAEAIEAIIAILEHRSPRKLLGHVVSGPMDCDKLDYLLRDSYFAGVQYGVFDLARIISEARILRVDGEEVVGISEKGIWAAEQLLFAKYHMFKQVYCHKIRSVSDAMIVRGVRLAIEEEVPGVLDMFAYRPGRDFLDRYMDADDDTLAAALTVGGAESASRRMFRRLRDRRLLKRVYHRLLDSSGPADQSLAYRAMTPADRRQREASIAAAVGVDAREVVLDVRGRPPSPTGLAAKDQILVERGGRPSELTEISDLFAGQAPQFEAPSVSVYLPVDGDDRAGRRDQTSAVAERVREVVEAS